MGSAVAAGRAPSLGTLQHAADAALADLYQSHSRWVLARCRAALRSREEAEDAMQVTFLQAFRALRRGVVPQHELAWLGTIADNVCRSTVRAAMRNARREASVENELRCAESSVVIDESTDDELAALKRGLRRLPETQRRAILLREWAGMSTREIALELETSVTAVDMLLHRARRALSLARAEGRWRRAFDLTWLAGALRQLLSGGSAAKVAAAVSTVAVATTGVAASAPDSVQLPPDPQRHAPIAALEVSAPTPGPVLRVRAASPAPTQERVVSTPAPGPARRAEATLNPTAAHPTASPIAQPSEPAVDRGAAPAPSASVPADPDAPSPVAQPPVAEQAAADPPVARQPVVELPVLTGPVQLPEQVERIAERVELPVPVVPVEPSPVALPVPVPVPPVPVSADPLPVPAPPAPPALPALPGP